MTTRVLSVVTGQAFSAGAALQDYARKQRWTAAEIRYWDFSTLEAKFGRYERARRFLKLAHELIKFDQLVLKLDTSLAKLQDVKAKELSKYFQHYQAGGKLLKSFDALLSIPPVSSNCDLECLRKDKRLLYYRVALEARLDRENGDYQAAISKYRDARRIADLSGLANHRRAANEGIIWSRQLRASWQERQNPGISTGWKNYNRMRRHDMAAARAEMLASHLSQAGQGRAAISYLREAGAIYRKLNPKRVPYISQEIVRLQADPKANLLAKTRDERPLTIYTHASTQAHIMLDAIEYGKGDWFKSIRYLEAAHAADPKNQKIFGALNYVRGLSAAE